MPGKPVFPFAFFTPPTKPTLPGASKFWLLSELESTCAYRKYPTPRCSRSVGVSVRSKVSRSVFESVINARVLEMGNGIPSPVLLGTLLIQSVQKNDTLFRDPRFWSNLTLGRVVVEAT